MVVDNIGVMLVIGCFMETLAATAVTLPYQIILTLALILMFEFFSP